MHRFLLDDPFIIAWKVFRGNCLSVLVLNCRAVYETDALASAPAWIRGKRGARASEPTETPWARGAPRGNRGARADPRRSAGVACNPAQAFGGHVHIFQISHTNSCPKRYFGDTERRLAGRPTSAPPWTSEGRTSGFGGLRGPTDPRGLLLSARGLNPPEQVPPGCARGRRRCAGAPSSCYVGLAPLVPYRTGHFLAVPCAARRPAVSTAPRNGGLAGWSPSCAVRRVAPPGSAAAGVGGCLASRAPARGRRWMGSVDGWPLARPTT